MEEKYDLMCSFRNLYNAHLRARRGKRAKVEVIKFELDLAQNLCTLQRQLQQKTYQPSEYKHFFVYDPKIRSIFAPDYADRVVQHCLCDNIIMPTLEPRLIHDNAACRLGKGTHFSIYRMTDFLRTHFRKHGANGYFLKCDIRKYFENIDHSVLKGKLQGVFDENVHNLLCRIIDSYAAAEGKGLPLGNQTSQWFALYYLDGMDRLIKERLQIRHYVRYMDDFVLLHHDKAYLRRCLEEIRRLLADLRLDLNEKTQIFPIKNGVNYLGWHFYLTETGKVVRKLVLPSKRRFKRRMKLLQEKYAVGRIDGAAVKRSIMSSHGHLLHGHTYRLRAEVLGGAAFRRS
ncbi:MAG: RNA-directed DNA polymerase [Turicibacter sp.]|nr:RNA-directed DNA polymerase [Turicibacter sp.]